MNIQVTDGVSKVNAVLEGSDQYKLQLQVQNNRIIILLFTIEWQENKLKVGWLHSVYFTVMLL